MPTPWWFSDVEALTGAEMADASLGELWNLSERLRFVRENVSEQDLAADVAANGAATTTWARFVRREAFVRGAKDSGSLDVDALVQERIDAKKSKNFARADEIRKQLDAAGIVLEDKPGGLTEWRRK